MSTIIEPNMNKNNLYCFLSCVLSRLAYLKMPEFYQKYIMIMNTLPKINLNNINDTSTIFDSKYDIDLVQFNLPQQINHIIDQRLKDLQQVKDKNIKGNVKQPSSKLVVSSDWNKILGL